MISIAFPIAVGQVYGAGVLIRAAEIFSLLHRWRHLATAAAEQRKRGELYEKVEAHGRCVPATLLYKRHWHQMHSQRSSNSVLAVIHGWQNWSHFWCKFMINVILQENLSIIIKTKLQEDKITGSLVNWSQAHWKEVHISCISAALEWP